MRRKSIGFPSYVHRSSNRICGCDICSTRDAHWDWVAAPGSPDEIHVQVFVHFANLFVIMNSEALGEGRGNCLVCVSDSEIGPTGDSLVRVEERFVDEKHGFKTMKVGEASDEVSECIRVVDCDIFCQVSIDIASPVAQHAVTIGQMAVYAQTGAIEQQLANLGGGPGDQLPLAT